MRYRVVQLLVVMINGLGEIESVETGKHYTPELILYPFESDDLYVLLRSSLLERARDKETPVRIQAALGLAKLRSGEDPDELGEDEENLDEV